MTTPHPESAGPITTDEALLVRIRELVGVAYRRQLWILLIDENGFQLPVLPQIDIPKRPDAHGGTVMANLLDLAFDVGGAELAIVYERPGPERLTIDDRRWLRLLSTRGRREGVRLRGPIFVHARGVRWVGAEDLDDPAVSGTSAAGRGSRRP